MYSCIYTHPEYYRLANYVSCWKQPGKVVCTIKYVEQNAKSKRLYYNWRGRDRERDSNKTLKGEWEMLLAQVNGSGTDSWFFSHFLFLPCPHRVLILINLVTSLNWQWYHNLRFPDSGRDEANSSSHSTGGPVQECKVLVLWFTTRLTIYGSLKKNTRERTSRDLQPEDVGPPVYFFASAPQTILTNNLRATFLFYLQPLQANGQQFLGN